MKLDGFLSRSIFRKKIVTQKRQLHKPMRLPRHFHDSLHLYDLL